MQWNSVCLQIEQYIVQNTGKELLTDLTDGTLTQTVSNVSSGYITLIDDNIQYDGTKWKAQFPHT